LERSFQCSARLPLNFTFSSVTYQGPQSLPQVPTLYTSPPCTYTPATLSLLWAESYRTHTSARSKKNKQNSTHTNTTTPTMSSQPLLQTAPGKRIALPTRVEPKVFFANERTFLSWLNFTVILGGLAIGLLNFGDKIGQISAGLFTLVALAAMLYALVTFHWRAKSIRMRGQGGFDDRFGPTVLAVALLAAVVVNFVLRVTG
jgi:uncharacterized membrane protein YidH (DUF202 family)